MTSLLSLVTKSAPRLRSEATVLLLRWLPMLSSPVLSLRCPVNTSDSGRIRRCDDDGNVCVDAVGADLGGGWFCALCVGGGVVMMMAFDIFFLKDFGPYNRTPRRKCLNNGAEPSHSHSILPASEWDVWLR